MHDDTTPPDDATAADNEAVDERVREMLGPSPTDPNPTVKDTPEPAKEPPQPVPVAADEEPAERVLVIPSSEGPSGVPPVEGTPLPPEQTAPTIPETGDIVEPTESLPDDEITQEAVDDIAAKESDEVLAAEDEEVAKAFAHPDNSLKTRLKNFFSAWWNNKKARWATIAGLVIILVLAVSLPISRYFLLNTAGVRGSASLTVLDDSTQLPLKNVQVSLAGQTSKTDDNGLVTLNHLKLGKSTLVIQKLAFANQSKSITIGWGSNPLGNQVIRAVGAQYTFLVKDWLSTKAVASAEATSGDASAKSDSSGKIVLTIASTEATTLPVTIASTGYRNEKITLDLTTKLAQTVNMVPARQQVFISNQSGKDDLFKIDIDGKNQKLILAGTGSEQDNIALVSHPTDEVAAMVSTRDNVHNADGFLLSTLTLVNLSNDTTVTVAQSERIQIIGWLGNNLIFVQIAAGASANNPKRYQLIAYDYKAAIKNVLASANSFNDVLVAQNNVYYAPASASGNPGGLFRISADGKTKATLLSQEVWNIFRVSYNSFTLSGQQDWYQYNLSDVLPTKLPAAPANPKNVLYLDSPDGKHSLWVDQRDGKGVLLSYDTTAKKDTVLETQSGLNYPVRWLNNSTLVYRIHTPTETADYVMSASGGQPHKIRDVFSSAGIELWYYY